MDKKESLWEEYKKKKSRDIRDEIILAYAPLVKNIASRLYTYLGSAVEFDDLNSMGIIGLIDAIDKYDDKCGTKFETYANIRIKGAILDQVRKADWVSRTLRIEQKRYTNTENSLYSKLGRQPTDAEMIEELGIQEEKYYATKLNIHSTNLLYLDNSINFDDGSEVEESIEQDTFESPEEHTLSTELTKKLKESLDILTERERRTIELYYYEGLNTKEIAKILEVSQGRVSQLHAAAVLKLREPMGDYMGILYRSI